MDASSHDAVPVPAPDRRRTAPLLGAVSFLVLHLAVQPVTGPITDDPLPLPNAPRDAVATCVADHPLVPSATGLLQGLSALGLAVSVGVSLLRARHAPRPGGRR